MAPRATPTFHCAAPHRLRCGCGNAKLTEFADAPVTARNQACGNARALQEQDQGDRVRKAGSEPSCCEESDQQNDGA